MKTYSTIEECSEEELLKLGVTSNLLEMLDRIGGNRAYLFVDKNEWAFPLVYFDTKTSFEFRFTAFQGDWSDSSQLHRFRNQLVLHRKKPTISQNN